LAFLARHFDEALYIAGSKPSKRATGCRLDVLTALNFVEDQRLSIVAPEFRRSDLCVQHTFIESRAADIDFDNDVGRRIALKVEPFYASNRPRIIADEKARVRLSPWFRALQRCRPAILNLNVAFGTDNNEERINDPRVTVVFNRRRHDFKRPRIEIVGKARTAPVG